MPASAGSELCLRSFLWAGASFSEGNDLTILAIGPLTYRALKAAELLSGRGLRPAVINCRFVKPLDQELILECSNRTKRVITIEENIIAGGFGSAVLELLSDHGYKGASSPLGVDVLLVTVSLYQFAVAGRPVALRELARRRGWGTVRHGQVPHDAHRCRADGVATLSTGKADSRVIPACRWIAGDPGPTSCPRSCTS